MKKHTYQLYLSRVLQFVFFSFGIACSFFLYGTVGASEWGDISFVETLTRIIIGSAGLGLSGFGCQFCARWYRYIRRRKRIASQVRSLPFAA